MNNERFLGNVNKMEVHDQDNEKSNCEISKIVNADHERPFNPDTLEQAHSQKYDNCAHCIGNSKK